MIFFICCRLLQVWMPGQTSGQLQMLQLHMLILLCIAILIRGRLPHLVQISKETDRMCAWHSRMKLVSAGWSIQWRRPRMESAERHHQE